MRVPSALAWLALCWSSAALAGVTEPPRWLAAAAGYQTPPAASGAPALVLWDEAEVTVDTTGRFTTVERYALRVLTPEGRKEAEAHKYYPADTAKVNELQGWLISPSGQVRVLGKDHVTDREPGDAFYEQARLRSLNASQECGEGWIFGYESSIEERSVFTQLVWEFQRRLPVIESRYVLHLPAGWEAKAALLNHGPVAPSVSGNRYVWEIRGLPYLEPEPGGPALTSLTPRLRSACSRPGGRAWVRLSPTGWTCPATRLSCMIRRARRTPPLGLAPMG